MKSGLQRIEATLNQLQTLSVSRAAGISINASPLPVQQPSPVPVNLPQVHPPHPEARRYATDPLLTMSLLKEIEGLVGQWQAELQNILLQIQEIHLEGPVVDGWLESGTPEPVPPPITEDTPPVPPLNSSHRAIYRLCGLDDKGQSWSRPCSAVEIPYLSLAIARSHKLRQLLQHKQTLELRLNRLAQDLIEVHGRL